MRETIVMHALRLVPFEGWTELTLEKAAREAGLEESEIKTIFPGGVVEAVDFFVRDADRKMVEGIKDMDLDAMKIRERIARSVWLMLEQNIQQREAIRRTLAFYALPHHSLHAIKSLYATVDSIWNAIGDTSTDYNFYTKRMLLAGVYSSTLLVWLDDDSCGQEASRAFLYRRIEDVMQIQKARFRISKWLDSCVPAHNFKNAS